MLRKDRVLGKVEIHHESDANIDVTKSRCNLTLKEERTFDLEGGNGKVTLRYQIEFKRNLDPQSIQFPENSHILLDREIAWYSNGIEIHVSLVFSLKYRRTLVKSLY